MVNNKEKNVYADGTPNFGAFITLGQAFQYAIGTLLLQGNIERSFV